MSQLGHKRKLVSKSITEKYLKKLIKYLKKLIKATRVFRNQKNNILKQTLSNWLKKKKQNESVDSNSSSMKRRRFRGSPYENIDDACYKWLVNANSPVLIEAHYK